MSNLGKPEFKLINRGVIRNKKLFNSQKASISLEIELINALENWEKNLIPNNDYKLIVKTQYSSTSIRMWKNDQNEIFLVSISHSINLEFPLKKELANFEADTMSSLVETLKKAK